MKEPEKLPLPEEGPTIVIEVDEGEIYLNWFNSCMRLFKDEMYDHIEYRDEENRLYGIRVAQVIMDALFEHNFPMHYEPIVDDETVEWFVESETKYLDDELGDL